LTLLYSKLYTWQTILAAGHAVFVCGEEALASLMK